MSLRAPSSVPRLLRTPWFALLAIGLVGSIAYPLTSANPATQNLLYNGLILVSFGASLIGCLRTQRWERPPWILSTAALGGFLVANLTWWSYARVDLDPYPSVADAVFLLSYVPLALAAVLLARRGHHDEDRSAWLDAGILTTVAGLLVWQGLLQPYVDDHTLTGAERATNLAYPLIGLLVLGAVLRLVLTRSARTLAGTLLALGVCATLVANLARAWRDLDGATSSGVWVDLLWLWGSLLIASGAIVPTKAPASTDAANSALGRGRLMVVLVAVIIPEVVLLSILTGLDDIGWQTTTIAVVVATLVSFLVVARFWGLLGTARLVEQRRAAVKLSAVIHHSVDTIVLTDASAHMTYASPAWATLTGTEADGVAGMRLLDWFSDHDQASLLQQFENLSSMATGATLPLEALLRPTRGPSKVCEGTMCNLLDDPAVGAIVVTLRDVSMRRDLEEQLERKAFHDDLTGLANRALFTDRVSHALERMQRYPGSGVAVVFVDLDDFKTVNDGLGHPAGDELLEQVANRLRTCLRPADTVARLGGDEFAILLEDVADVDRASELASRITEALRMPMHVADDHIAVSASVGVALASPDSSVDTLMRDADIAMYSAKAQGKGRVAVFDDKLRAAAQERLILKVELPEALRQGQFAMVYQPIIGVNDQALHGFEALLRWYHPARGEISPEQFIPVAEESGIIVEIGRWVLAQACRQAADWNRNAPAPIAISVNVSAVQLKHPGFLDDLHQVLDASGLSPRLLTLELTESVLIEHQRIEELLRRLRHLGVGVAIDDFGTGYSSLSYLQRFPVTSVKVDRAFISELSRNGDQGVVRSILALAEALALTTVAEGVETKEQLRALDALDCGLAQGFYLGRPLTAEEISGDRETWLAKAAELSAPL